MSLSLQALFCRRPKWHIASERLILLLAVWFGFALNLGFWRFIAERIEITGGAMLWFAISLLLFALVVFVWIFSLLLVNPVAKPLIVFLMLLSSAANYGMFRLGIYIDSDMMRNVLESNAREAADFLTPGALLWVFATGVLPAAALALARVEYRSFRREATTRLIFAAAGLTLLACIAATAGKEYAAFFRNHNQARKLVNTINYVYATVRHFQRQAESERAFVRLDASVRAAPWPNSEKTVLIFILGETARAASFSLQGYARETNPLMSRQDIVYFRNAYSCGTATAVSVPCLFSHAGRREFDVDTARHTQNLLDVLADGGYEILWRENDDGCKGVCARAPTEDVTKPGDPRHCEKNYCRDEVLLEGLEEKVKNAPGNLAIFLHAMGSHGPSYYRRYPERFKRFTPTCDTPDIQNCSREAIVNTYDNTILYTDYIVSSVIEVAKKFPQLEIGVIYVSDHGESLGENGAYLHGLPYVIAPDEQKHIPLLFWFSDTMKRLDRIDENCLRRKAASEEVAHDHLFHSIVSLLEVETSLYRPEWDIFNGCRTWETG
jgi:lipid A ethanolaminephosphotransferase